MAAVTIFHEGNRLREASARTASIINSMKLVNSTISRIHDSELSSFWEGDAFDQNKSNHKKLKSMIDKYLQEAEKTKTALDSAIAAYDKTETTQKAKVSQLDTKNIF